MAKVIFEFTEEQYSECPADDGDEINSQLGISVSVEGLSAEKRLNMPDLYARVLLQNADAVLEAVQMAVNHRMAHSGYQVGTNTLIQRKTH